MRNESVTTLKRQATALLAEIARDREPMLITRYGIPSAYLVDAETYESLQKRLTLLESIAHGEAAVEDGRTFTHARAKQDMAGWLR